MSILCTKDYTINVASPSCAFIQDATNDNLPIDSGVFYSPDRDEMLCLHFTGGSLFLINTNTRTGGPKIVYGLAFRYGAWCPANAKWYMSIQFASAVSYNPATNVFDPTIGLGGIDTDGCLYAPSTGKMYFITAQKNIWEVNPATNVPTQRFTTGTDFYGYQIDFSPTLGASGSIIGAGLKNAGNYFTWVFDLATFTMTTTVIAAPGALGTLGGVCWDSTRSRIWIAVQIGADLALVRCVPGGAIEYTTFLAGKGLSDWITYNLPTNSIYLKGNTTRQAIRYLASIDNATAWKVLTDVGFQYAFGDSGPYAFDQFNLWYTSARTNPGTVGGVRSCSTGQFL